MSDEPRTRSTNLVWLLAYIVAGFAACILMMWARGGANDLSLYSQSMMEDGCLYLLVFMGIIALVCHQGLCAIIAALSFFVAFVLGAVPSMSDVDGGSGNRGTGFLFCVSNLKNTGTALEMYATDNTGEFPQSLKSLTPNYLKTIPTCPSAGADTYSGGYAASRSLLSNGKPVGAYTVVCSGANHTRRGNVPPNFPQYTSTQGLIENPANAMTRRSPSSAP